MKKSTRLKISRETLRTLSSMEARQVAGGIPTIQVGPVPLVPISIPARACCLGPEEVFLPPEVTGG